MNFNLMLDKNECVGLYGFLKLSETELPPELTALLRRLETVLFEHLSIEDVELLTSGGGKDLSGGKG